ncbi:MAG: methyltransferase domain-containing protein [Lautropia sp.]
MQALSYTPFEKLSVARPVDRIRHIASRCADKVVLDLGAMDETAFAAKRGRGTWLHEEIARGAARVQGIDSSPAVPESGTVTAPNARIDRVAFDALDDFLAANALRPEVVVAGELIEHLDNALGFFATLRSIAPLRGATLLVSTPNATAIHNTLVGLVGRESTHVDHLAIHSYKTLNTLLRRSGFDDWTITPYRSHFVELLARTRGATHAGVRFGQSVINAAEYCFPLLSFGYVVQTRL